SMPQGGKVGISAIPLILASYQLGVRKGLVVIVASLFARFALIKPPYFVSMLQLFVDYFLAYGVYALSGLVKDMKLNKLSLPIGVLFTNLLRYLAHSVAGILFFPSGENMTAIIIGSLSYNLPYMAVTAVVCFIVVMEVKPRLLRNN
ncbi:MAG: hypothetical protein GX038_04315, partial [Erysipelothrix sp.]|nr:hypothetical protein [Erysipelothrix sp.]